MTRCPCPVPGCVLGRNPTHLMCSFHWRRVPPVLQQLVYATWHEFQRHKRDPLNCLEKMRVYRTVAAEAVRVVALEAVP